MGLYETADGRYISFVMMQPTKFWADVCRHMDVTEYIDDPRFASAEQIAAHTADAVEILGKAMATRTLEEWSARFATLAGPWAPVQDTLQAAADAQVRANDYLVRAGELELVSNPVQFDVAAPVPGPRPASPSRPTRSSRNSDWTGTGSSSSRPPARSPDGRAGDLMRHATIAGTRRAATRARSAHSRSAFDLPSGRYLHTTSKTGEHVSRIVIGNEPQPLPNSKVRLSFTWPRPGTSAGSRATSPESGCPAGRLGAIEGAPSGHGNVRLRPPSGGAAKK